MTAATRPTTGVFGLEAAVPTAVDTRQLGSLAPRTCETCNAPISLRREPGAPEADTDPFEAWDVRLDTQRVNRLIGHVKICRRCATEPARILARVLRKRRFQRRGK